MYQVDMLSEGETVYRLIPGWFDGIVVDEMTVRWNADRAIGHEPDCTVEGGYFTWRKPLAKGEQYRVSVTYPNDAYGFDTTKEILSGTERSGGEGYGGGGGGFAFLGLLVFLVPIALILFTAVSRFNRTANLTGGDIQRMIQRNSEKAMQLAQEDIRKTLNIQWNRELVAPVSAGEVLGTLSFTAPDGSTVTADLTATRDVASLSRAGSPRMSAVLENCSCMK